MRKERYDKFLGSTVVEHNDGKVVACCYGLDELQEHLVGVEIVKVEELEDDE